MASSSNPQTVFSNDIFHGLPTLAEARGKRLSAIVTGANGITGTHIVQALADAPDRWETVYALSRKPPASQVKGNVKYLEIDFLSSGQAIAKQLNEQVGKVDYVFFASYVQVPPKHGQGLWSDAEEMERVNLLLLSNFLTGLTLSKKIPKRVLLQTGAKHYGVHLGPPLNPMEESDPRFQAEPNFYFGQEDLLWKWAKDNSVEWNVTRPGFIIGAVREASMNIAYGLAVYAAVQGELGQRLEFPGDVAAWDAEKHLTSARLIGYHAEWAVLTPSARNQILNSADNSLFTYGKFWPVLAALHNIPCGKPEPDDTKYQSIEMPTRPPPRGFGPAGKIRVAWTFEAWAAKPEVREAWAALKSRHGLTPEPDPFDRVQDVFGLLDGEILGPWGRSLSVGKSQKHGWHGFVDTHDSLIKTFQQLAHLNMLPPINEVDQTEVRYEGY